MAGRVMPQSTPTRVIYGKKHCNAIKKHYHLTAPQFIKADFFVLTFSPAVIGLSRGPMRMRAERSGRDGPGPSLRGGSSNSRGRSSFNDRDGRPIVMSNQVSFFLGSLVLMVQGIDRSCKKDRSM